MRKSFGDETYNDVLADPVNGHAGQAIEFTFTVAVITEFLQKVTGRIEHLHSVVGAIGNDDGIVGSHSDSPRPSERSGFAATSADLHQHLALLHVLMSGR